MIKKLTAIITAMLLTVSMAMLTSGCGSDVEQIDETKTQLYISNNDQGVGRSFIEKIGEAFAEDFADYSFEEGKKGVQIFYNHNTVINSSAFYVTMEEDSDYIYFTEGVDYKQYSHKFYNVTDTINGKALKGVDGSGNLVYEDYTISSLVNNTYKQFADRDASDGEDYRAVPLYLATKTFIYDIDLWNTYSFYFSKNGCPSEILVKAVNDGTDLQKAIADYNAMLNGPIDDIYFVDGNGVYSDGEVYGKSAGPDGEYGTKDDGLPATYDEFYLLMNVMATKVTPIIWSGGNPQYADMLTTQLWTDYMGAEQLKTYYSLNGTVNDLIVLDGNGEIVMEGNSPKTESKTFDGGLADGYEIQRTAGKYYALQFVKEIVKNADTWTSNVCWGRETQTGTQSVYLTYGKTETKAKDIAMLIDGGWWQQEATATFDNMATVSENYSKQNRNFGILNLPNATVDRFIERINLPAAQDKNTLVVTNDSYCFINGNLQEGSAALEVSKAFFSYFHSKKALDLFAKETSMTRALEYTGYSRDGMTPYCKNYVDYVENSNIIYPYSTNKLMNDNRTVFANFPDAWNWCSKTSAGDSTKPLSWLKDKSSVTPENYFCGLYKYYKDKWGSLKK